MKYLLTLCLLISLSTQVFGRVIGGSKVDDPKIETPFFVRVGLGCGGSLVSPSLVLTAAHCLHKMQLENPALIEVKLVNDLKLTPVKVIIHPDNNKKDSSPRYDFALIQISEVIDSKHVIEIFRQDLLPGIELTSYGFGRFDMKIPKFSPFMKKITEKLISTEEANSERSYKGDVKEEMIAAGTDTGTEGTCTGDSGGPMVYRDKDEKAYLVGVVSWGEGCAVPFKYSVYGNVQVIQDWITQNTP